MCPWSHYHNMTRPQCNWNNHNNTSRMLWAHTTTYTHVHECTSPQCYCYIKLIIMYLSFLDISSRSSADTVFLLASSRSKRLSLSLCPDATTSSSWLTFYEQQNNNIVTHTRMRARAHTHTHTHTSCSDGTFSASFSCLRPWDTRRSIVSLSEE